MTIRELAIAVGFEVTQRSINETEGAIKGIKNMATKLLGAIGIGLSITGIMNLAETAADVEALESQFSQVFGNMEEDAASKLKNIEEDTGILSDRMKGSFTQIAAFSKTTGMDEKSALDIANRSMIAVADSAAFYDKSIEQATESLQSFLKGNFENDAALGLSCTETTRNAAANKLYGKSFKDLAEDQKQLTLLSMVEDANRASGALGQAARESDTWTNQLGNLRQRIKSLKATLGKGLLKNGVRIIKDLSTVIGKVTEKVAVFTREGGPMERILDKIYDTINSMKPVINDIISFIKKVLDKVGGTQNALKILAAILASIFVVKNAWNIVEFVKKLATMINAVSLKTLALIAIVALIILIVDDFINFMKGNDSVIGELLKKAGIDTDAFRDKVKSTWEGIKNFLINTWYAIKLVAKTIFGGIKGFFDNHGAQLLGIFKSVWEIIKMYIVDKWNEIKDAAVIIFGLLKAFWDKWGDKITAQFGLIFGIIDEVFNNFLNQIQNILDFLTSVFTGDWEGAWEAVKNIFSTAWDNIKDIAGFMWDSLVNMFGDKIDIIKEMITGWYDHVIGKISGAVEALKGFLGLGGDVGVSVSTGTAALAGYQGTSTGKRTINQTNNITNTFNGGDAYRQNVAGKAMSKSGEDVTDAMRRSIANS